MTESSSAKKTLSLLKYIATNDINLDFNDGSLHLVKPIKGLEKNEVIIEAGTYLIGSGADALLECQRIVIEKDDITLENLHVKGSIVIRNCENITMKNVFVTGGDTGSGGGVVVNNVDNFLMDNCDISTKEVPCIYVENNSNAHILNSTAHDSDGTLMVAASSSYAHIQNCRFVGTAKNGIYAQDSKVNIQKCYVAQTIYPAIYSNKSESRIIDTSVEKVLQNGITVNHCTKFLISGCKLSKIESSALSISRSDGVILTNNVFDIGGNGAYVSEDTKVEILNNKFTDCKFPAVALLSQSEANVKNNIITNMERSALCVRSASKVYISNNVINGASECGISTSDTQGVIIENNIIKNCAFSACEAYNSSSVTFRKNECDVNGKFGVMAYSSAKIFSSNNSYSGITALAQLRFKGSLEAYGETISNETRLLDGATSEDYLFVGCGDAPVKTNVEEYGTKYGVTAEPRYRDMLVGKCIRCQRNDRGCFLKACGHCVYCLECGRIAKEAGETCPLCRFPIDDITPGFTSTFDDLCVICSERTADAIVFPCGHIGFCSTCLAKWFLDNDTCPMCRESPSFYKKILKDI